MIIGYLRDCGNIDEDTMQGSIYCSNDDTKLDEKLSKSDRLIV